MVVSKQMIIHGGVSDLNQVIGSMYILDLIDFEWEEADVKEIVGKYTMKEFTIGRNKLF